LIGLLGEQLIITLGNSLLIFGRANDPQVWDIPGFRFEVDTLKRDHEIILVGKAVGKMMVIVNHAGILGYVGVIPIVGFLASLITDRAIHEKAINFWYLLSN
jgi:hypothetical protein